MSNHQYFMKLLVVALTCIFKWYEISDAELIKIENEQVQSCYRNLPIALEFNVSGVKVGDSVEDVCGPNGECQIFNSTFSYCNCIGHIGEQCETKVLPDSTTYGISIGIVIGIFALTIVGSCIYLRKNKGKDFEALHKTTFLFRFREPTRTNSFVIFVYRVCVVIFCFSTHVSSIALFSPSQYRFYTIQTFILLITTFFIGAVLSSVETFGTTERQESTFIRRLEKIHFVMFEALFSASAVVDVVFWILLFCAACEVEGTNIIQHLINFVFILGDLILVRYRFLFAHVFFVFLWPIWYAFFHFAYTLSRDERFGHEPVYTFLDMSIKTTPIFVAGVILVHAVFHAIGTILSRLLNRCTYSKSWIKQQDVEDNTVAVAGDSKA